jgi:hypothetical protein
MKNSIASLIMRKRNGAFTSSNNSNMSNVNKSAGFECMKVGSGQGVRIEDVPSF